MCRSRNWPSSTVPGARHQVLGPLRLRERDDFADARRADQEPHEPVQPERDAPVRRGAEPQRLQQEAEFHLGFLFVDAEKAEDALLDVRPMDTDASSAEFHAVEDQVIRPRGPTGAPFRGVPYPPA